MTDRIVTALDLPEPTPRPDDPDTRTNGREPATEAASSVRRPIRTSPGQAPDLAHEPDILDRFRAALRRAGVAGEERLATLTYLALTSRLLPWGKAGERPVSVLAKGTSSTGKSYTQRTVLRFFPAPAWLDLGSMSNKYLFYAEENLQHRFIVVPEWASIADNEELVALLRVLLSEGRIVHGTVDERRKATRIEKDGPTALLMTTTSAAVDPELETRCLSVTTDDTREQTRAVFAAIADLEDDEHGFDFGPWHELQEWLDAQGERRVAIPFVRVLAEHMPVEAARLRRDFVAVLSLVRAHALLYQAQRDRDGHGRIVATLDDYEAVRLLVGEIIAEGVEASVTRAMRETVEAAGAIIEAGSAHVGAKELIDKLGVGRSATYDRITRALRAGYLINDAGRNERGYKLTIGAPLPGVGDDFLPSAQALVRVQSVSPPGRANTHGQEAFAVLSGSPGRPAALPHQGQDDR